MSTPKRKPPTMKQAKKEEPNRKAIAIFSGVFGLLAVLIIVLLVVYS
ncbi:hypothetical protein M3223_07280 [Paenibacillus pasadenensis]|nr:hypothetical protein [Paenibacillus pasadenensis]MCM3747156.1 hypothetical protein [Paenibacillus pasadenensis]